jgi:hypothetical protein
VFDPVAVGLTCLAAATVLMAVAWYLCNVALPWLESKVSESGFSPAAKAQARALFLSKLTARQRRSWLLRRRIVVCGSGGRRYTLCNYEAYNVHAWDAAFCLQVEGDMPAYDKLLAQKLLLECDEPYFLASANVRTFSSRWQHLIAASIEDCRARGLLTTESFKRAA